MHTAPFLLGLTVVAGCAGTRSAVSDDATIDHRVARRLDESREVGRYEIDADAEDGVVTLRGAVDDRTQRTSAEQIARDTPGVVEVENMVLVEDDDSRDAIARAVDDAMLESTVGSRVVHDPTLRSYRIAVEAHDGVVRLDGIVRDSDTRRRAQRIAQRTDGVSRVDNQLKISGPSLKTIP